MSKARRTVTREVENAYRSWFDELDLNGNGSLSLDECNAYFKGEGKTGWGGADVFKQADTNEDGAVSAEEFIEKMAAIFERSPMADAAEVEAFKGHFKQ
mmetsp:Transcript_25455/g.28280  ORF Transcript_25455/g.28280 Transcript_25455/m.28280 type:complete len:99 (+) Transcript_25455:27-323(+)|eukprot:CAMPEP_0205823460 /NCGR_PEP_ID=MMETSP0206-20130828/16688_1 /ASSEMBLY_ACC=CAM_ASM_000279 /TAXON_ID=36767 /ORGANISM="Euplotes focardii, Strain TN1" /LENGTH=98 /DNA_ID=CAMNT_0053120665 /DNA_START=25 /DNA_END=321 /DNA_ORIENTATION=+